MSRFCRKPFHYLHLDPGGGCRLCSWMDASIGDLTKDDLHTVWHSKEAQILRDAVRAGNFEYCRAQSCPFLENDELPNLTEEEVAAQSVLPDAPDMFSVSCDFICNHSCPSCRQKVFQPDESYRQKLTTILKNISPALQTASYVSTCGNGDAFASPYIMEMLEHLHPQNPDCTINIETNGTLFDEAHWQRISHLGQYDFTVTVTPNSFVESTFRCLNGGHDTYHKIMHNLGFLRDLREKGILNEYRISIVVQDRNFMELPSFVDRCLYEFHADQVLVKPLYRWFGISADTYWFKDVLNPLHPYHDEYRQMLTAPILKDPRVYFWGGHHDHPAERHPAYIFEEHMQLAAKLMEPGMPQKLADELRQRGATSCVIYGDMDLGAILYRVLTQSDLPVHGFVARDICSETRCGQKILPMDQYKNVPDEAVIVLHYDFMEKIARDLHFLGCKGAIVSVKELVESVAL